MAASMSILDPLLAVGVCVSPLPPSVSMSNLQENEERNTSLEMCYQFSQTTQQNRSTSAVTSNRECGKFTMTAPRG